MPQTQPSTARRPVAQPAVQTFRLSSAAFADGAKIPPRHTADGENVSPHLSWNGPPAETESFALLCEDLDSRSGNFAHWLAWDIDPSASTRPSHITPPRQQPADARCKRNSGQKQARCSDVPDAADCEEHQMNQVDHARIDRDIGLSERPFQQARERRQNGGCDAAK
jgi:phosphatidylethanolamine-binding protein (PEBP) family uncharacterized protein